eukprot:scaffold2319_cov248-Pinguiococcus_pyrenoidosus.AAC.14
MKGVPNVKVATFRCHHRTASNAYGLYINHRKLRAAFKGKPGKELAELKKQGEDITEDVLEPVLLFCGDTTQQFFEDPTNVNVEEEAKEGEDKAPFHYPTDIWGFQTIIIECTMIDRSAEDKVRRISWRHRSLLEPLLTKHVILEGAHGPGPPRSANTSSPRDHVHHFASESKIRCERGAGDVLAGSIWQRGDLEPGPRVRLEGGKGGRGRRQQRETC